MCGRAERPSGRGGMPTRRPRSPPSVSGMPRQRRTRRPGSWHANLRSSRRAAAESAVARPPTVRRRRLLVGIGLPALGRVCELTPAHCRRPPRTTALAQRNRNFHMVRGCRDDAMPPCGRQAARRCARPIAPHFDANARGIGERAIVNEVHPARALSPVAGLKAPLNGVATEATPLGLRKCYDAVVAMQIVVEHTSETRRKRERFPRVVGSW